MYSVMIVDDEPLIRTGLNKTVKWEEYGFKVICECSNGEEAIEELRKQKIDFIITDIKMNRVSGIDILRIVRNMKLNTIVVLLSGYDEFSYAQEGLRLGAFDYILKPLNTEKLQNVLVNAYKKLAENDKKSYEFKLNKTISREKILCDLLKGKNLIDMDEYILKYKLPLIKDKVQVAIVEINKLVISSEKLIENDQCNYLERAIDNAIKMEFINKGITHYSIVDGDLGRKFIIVQADWKIEIAVLDNMFTGALKSILRTCNDDLGIVVNIGIGKGYSKIYFLYKSCINAKEALSYKYILGTNRVIHFEELKEMSNRNFIYPEQQEKILVEYIIEGKDDSINILKELIKEIAQVMNFDVFRINIIITQVINNIYTKVLKKYSALKELYNLSEIVKVGFLGNETLSNIEEKLIDNISSLINVIKEYKLNQRNNVVQKACEYILKHVNEDITLTSISNHLNISKNYFCSIFKQQTGENFLEYLTKVKMDRAKILLKNYDYKVYEVSGMLGYKETGYFSKLFKKHTGNTPIEYKKYGK
ncbi:response regulator transcription factor [Clostridium felsineum]|uniref:response regulator transcription factor n=1 Tax=Clostridium felsineum TaxID=36839 RepID=UPI00098CC877|nr:response regulator [Clostridium felsineum]URZ17103.1 Regulator of RpoS [Clostridium felsineum DSM 794]